MAICSMLDQDLANKRVLIREDLNVPIDAGKVTSTKRLEAILPTLRLALDKGARIILMSHLGRPKEGQFDPHYSLAPVADTLSKLLGQPVQLIKDFEDSFSVAPGEIALLENTRFNNGEKTNDPELAKRLAAICDLFVMDAFATAHRKEASTYGVAQYAPLACAGPLLLSEIAALAQILEAPGRPLTAIVGGAKVSTKLHVLKNLLSQVDSLIVGGGIANTFLVAAGYEVGGSLYEPELVYQANEMLDYARSHHKQILLPDDVVVANSFSPQAKATIKELDDMSADDLILDMGPRTIEKMRPMILQAKTILWNGPLGVFEWDQFAAGTKALAEAIAQSDAYSVAGGGDTIAAIEKFKIEDKVSYISTGGGAFLELLEGKKLPAIEILENKSEQG